MYFIIQSCSTQFVLSKLLVKIVAGKQTNKVEISALNVLDLHATKIIHLFFCRKMGFKAPIFVFQRFTT